MKVKFLKDHLRFRKDEIAHITDESANYFIRCNVAIEIKMDSPKEVKIQMPNDKKSKSKKK